MKSFSVIILVAAIILVTSCVGVNGNAPQATPSNQGYTLPPTLIASPFAVLKTPSATSTPNLIIPPEAHLVNNCLKVSSMLPANTFSDGTIIFLNRKIVNGFYASGVFYFDTVTKAFVRIDEDNESLLNFSVSPDMTKVAYKLMKLQGGKVLQTELVVSNAYFQQLIHIPWKDDWGSILSWKDNDHLLIRVNLNLRSTPDSIDSIWSLLVLDIQTGEEQIIKPDLPDIYDWQPIPDWQGWGITMYDPTLSRLVYLHWVNKGSTYSYALWDMQKHQILVSPRIVGYPTPRWSYDGAEFVTTGLVDKNTNELFSISKDGQVEQLTNLTAYDKNIGIVDYSWSPNGRYIALLLDSDTTDLDNHRMQLAVLDTVTSYVVNYCIQTTTGGDTYGKISAPIWSPNSQRLVMVNWYEQDHRNVIMVDLVNNFAVQIAADMEPLGWMMNP